MPELMRSMTDREYQTRLAWIEENMGDPTRSDYYLMQIAQEVRRVMAKKPNRIKLKDFFLKFAPGGKAKQKKTTMEDSKRVWHGVADMLKAAGKVVKKDGS